MSAGSKPTSLFHLVTSPARFLARKDVHAMRPLVWAFCVAVTLCGMVAGLGVWTLSQTTRLVDATVHGGAQDERAIRDWLAEIRANAVRTVVLSHNNDADIRKLLAPEVDTATSRIAELQKRVEQTLSTAEARHLYGVVTDFRRQYAAARNEAIKSRDTGNPDATARIVEARLIPAEQDYVGAIQGLLEHQQRFVDNNGQDAIASAHAGRILFIAVALLMLLLAACVVAGFIVVAARPMAKPSTTVESIAVGFQSNQT